MHRRSLLAKWKTLLENACRRGIKMLLEESLAFIRHGNGLHCGMIFLQLVEYAFFLPPHQELMKEDQTFLSLYTFYSIKMKFQVYHPSNRSCSYLVSLCIYPEFIKWFHFPFDKLCWRFCLVIHSNLLIYHSLTMVNIVQRRRYSFLFSWCNSHLEKKLR